MMTSHENPFIWDKSATAVSGSVVSLSLGVRGTPLEVSGLSEPVDIFIPRYTTVPEPTVFATKQGSPLIWNFHEVFIKERDRAVNVQVEVLNKSDNFDLYFRSGHKPTEEAYDWKVRVPLLHDSLKCLPPRRRCPLPSLHKTTIFLPSRIVQPGKSYIALKHVMVSGPPVPLAKNVSNIAARYSLRIFLSRCLYWNEEKEKWTSDGCVVRSFIT